MEHSAVVVNIADVVSAVLVRFGDGLMVEVFALRPVKRPCTESLRHTGLGSVAETCHT